MRIAQISPLYESVPPQKYGGTERVVSYLTEELVKDGHEVTLFASGDSITCARLLAPCETSLRLNTGYDHCLVPHMLMFEELRRRASEFDVLHFHTEYLHFSMLRDLNTPSLTTMHGRLDVPQYIPLFREYQDVPLVSISNSQRKPLPQANWQATIYHGLPENLYKLNPRRGSYAVFLGRISREKRPDLAIEIAKRAGVPLKIAAKVDPIDRTYYEQIIRPLIDDSPNVEFLGEINDHEKNDLLGNASVLLCPIDWPEPFGLVMIEAMACGTPVIAFRNGSAPEVVTEGVTGFVVDSVEQAVAKLEVAAMLDRVQCYKTFKKRFSMETVLRSYLAAYEGVIDSYEERPFLELAQEAAM